MRRIATLLAGWLFAALSAHAQAQNEPSVPTPPVPTQPPAQVQVQDKMLDDFDNPSAWTIAASDDVKASLRSVDGEQGRALCIDFDFGRVTGYVAARRVLPIEYPARYEFALRLRGNAPKNAFQMKLIDESGTNVWWGRRDEYRVPADCRV